MMQRLLITGLLLCVPLDATRGQTAESSGAAPVTRLVFGSCIKQDQPTPIFDVMRRTRPDLLVFLGDNIYADTTDIGVMRAKYKRLRSNEQFRSLIAVSPVVATWDDHDYGVNDGGADYPMRALSQQAFLDFWDVAADSPRRERPGIYDARVYGPAGRRLQVILLDTRYFRSPLKQGPRQLGGPYVPDDSPDKTMLGEAQWQWLERQLRVPAEVRIIASSIQCIAEAAGQETWANLPHERERLFRLIDTTEAGGVIIISGDRHWAEISSIAEGVSYPLVDATSSSLNQKHGRGTPTKNRFRSVEETFHDENFGVIAIDWQSSDPTISIEIRDLQNNTRLEHRMRLSELQPR